jgi:sortase B
MGRDHEKETQEENLRNTKPAHRTAEDVKREKKKSPLLSILLVVCLAAFVFAGYMLIQGWTHYEESASEYREISAEYGPEDAQGAKLDAQETDAETKARVLREFTVDFDSLRAVNEEVVGWIVIHNTNISYPIVQAADNDRYLTTTFLKTYNTSGAIFADCNNNADFSDRNTYIYGHNMKNGSMFAQLMKLRTQQGFDERSEGVLYTPDAVYRLELFAVHSVDEADVELQYNFASDEAYESYLNGIRRWSAVQSGAELSRNDRIVTLFTCVNDDIRLLVYAKLVEVDQDAS